MCGIFGFAAWHRRLPAISDLSKATNLLRHRGPDGGACWHEPDIFLGHRRLAIIDLSPGGTQPMATADGRYVITYNGEIYNYPELREELSARGLRFATASDTEVILAGYAAWGPEVVSRLEGMFAFGLYDRLERTLFLARDRFGEKPLLVAAAEGQVAFASELGPLAAIGVGDRAIDIDALGGFLCLNYVPGTRTLLKGVERVAPAEWRLYGATGVLRTGRYWSAPDAPATDHRSTGELLDELQHRLDRAVRITLRSDVPVGLFLSAGVDSSVVAQSAARLGRLERAYCVDIATSGFSEWSGASHVARRIGMELERVTLDSGALHEFIELTRHLDDPVADSSALAVWTVARAAGQQLKVVLSGDGGDELFGGYITYKLSQWHRRLRMLLPATIWQSTSDSLGRWAGSGGEKLGYAAKLQRFLRAMPLETGAAHFTWNGSWVPPEAAALASDLQLKSAAERALEDLVPARAVALSMHDLQVMDTREYLANDILVKVDRATMAHGLESRTPLLNPPVAEFALRLPLQKRINAGVTKYVLRELCARHYGRAYAYAPKRGFSIPVHTWLRTDGRALMHSLLSPERVSQLGILDTAAISRAVAQHAAGTRPLGWELWGLMVLVAWFENRVLHPPDLRQLPEADDLPRVSLAGAPTAIS